MVRQAHHDTLTLVPLPLLTFLLGQLKKQVTPQPGDSILKIALDNGIPMEHACGGNGFCTTCMCKVSKGMDQLNARNDREENMGLTSDPWRLGCQARVQGEGDVEVEIFE